MTQKKKNIITFSILMFLLVVSLVAFINRKSIVSFTKHMRNAQEKSDILDSQYNGDNKLLDIEGVRLSDGTLVAKDGNIYSNDGKRVLLCQANDEYVTFPDNTKVYFDGRVYFDNQTKDITSNVYLDGSYIKSLDDKEVAEATDEGSQENYTQGNGGSTNSGSTSNSKTDYDTLVNRANTQRQEGIKDKYQTDPTPEGMPTPVEPEDVTINKNISKVCTLSIGCSTILNNMDMFNMDKIDCLPSNGIILPTTQVTFYEGESVYDVLERETSKRGIHMESLFTPMYNSAYVEGINNLYEFDCGPNSGWMYKVNGWYPNYGASRYHLKQGDVICWEYTCDLGYDLGCEWIGETK